MSPVFWPLDLHVLRHILDTIRTFTSPFQFHHIIHPMVSTDVETKYNESYNIRIRAWRELVGCTVLPGPVGAAAGDNRAIPPSGRLRPTGPAGRKRYGTVGRWWRPRVANHR